MKNLIKNFILSIFILTNINILGMESKSPEVQKILERIRYHLEKDNSVVKQIVIQRQLDQWDEQENMFNRLLQTLRDDPEILKRFMKN